MGEVWRARDTRLRRLVAIKTLPPDLAREPDRLARLEREAELLAALNHHHIATIHGIEEHSGTRFLVLELVEGTTLEDRLRRGAIPVDEALTLALQLAQGLEAAHAKEVVHRDLKPANIKITPDKRVKILDFGIAKALASALEHDETRDAYPTQTGAVIGTPAYMSPEQARGEGASVQADIWSFGAVLYEMLSGTSPFKRKTTAETIACVLEGSPDYTALPADTPPLARRLVERCVEKDPSRRFQHIGDVRILVEDILATTSARTTEAHGRATPRRDNQRLAWIAACVAAAAISGMGFWFLGRRSPATSPATPIYVSMAFRGRLFPFPFGYRHLAIAPDGSMVAFMSANGLWIRRMDQKDAVAITTVPGSNPFFSPDGEWVGWFPETGLTKVPVRGGAAVPLAASTDRPAGAAWRDDGTIVFATSEGLYQVSANGGERKLLLKPDRERKELLYAWPQFIPSGQLLFTVLSEAGGQPPQLSLLNLTTLERKTVLSGSAAYYTRTGHLLYISESKLQAVGFDAATGALRGKPIAFPEVEVTSAADNAAANFAISETGTLIFSSPPTAADRTLQWIDRQGNREELPVEPQNYGYAMVSPDGTRVAVERTVSGNRDIWILDLKRMTQTQLTDGPTEDMLPVWSSDGQRIFFASRRTGNFDVYSQAADGASSAKVEYAGPEFQAPNAVTPDGTRLLVYDRFKDISVLTLGQTDRLGPLLTSNADERLGQLSPDGHWIAYESDESGNQFEVMLRSFPNVNERREKISVDGGRYPRWGPKSSHELYYVDPEGRMMAASIRLEPTLTVGAVKKLFDWQKPTQARSGLMYDIAPDGRFLVQKLTTINAQGPTNVSVVLNWLSRLQNPDSR